MSEKHLTEKLWKDLVAKQGVKDLGLQKALAAYAKVDAATEPAKALEAIKEISELALKLKKICSAKMDVVDHLDELVKEVKKTMPALEARVKAQEKSAEAAADKTADKPEEAEDEAEQEAEQEAAEFKKDLKKQMVSALAQVKMRAPGEPEQEKEPKPQLQFMAYLAGKGCSVIVARKVGNAMRPLLPEIAGGATGGKFFKGECIFEQNAHTFVLETVPGGLSKKLAAALQAETGAKYKVRARSTDGSMVLDSDTDVDPDAAPPSPAAPTQPPAGEDEMAKFTARFKALQPELIKAIATKTPQAEEAKQRAAEASGLATKKDFAGAHRVLDAVEALMKQAFAVSVPPPAADPDAPPKQIKLSTYLTGRKNLRAARESAEAELKRLQQAILAKAADESFYKEVEAKSQKLFEYLAPIDDSVANKLDDAGRCTDPEDQANKNQEVRKLIAKQLTSLRSHPMAGFVEKNPFGKFIIKQPLEVTLSALDKQLA